MSRVMKVLIGVAAVAGVAVAVVMAMSKGVPVDTAAVERGTVRTYVEERGKTRLPEIYRLTMPLDGRIERISLKEGDTVSNGDVVAQMETADLDTDLAEATARVDQFKELLTSMEATIKSADSQLLARKEQFKYRDEEFKRIRPLKERGAATESELRDAETKMLESRYDVAADQFTIQAIVAMKAAVEIGKEDFDEQRKKRERDRQRAKLLSPVAGTILQRHVSNERVLPAGEPLLEIGNLDELEVGVEVLTQDVVAIQIGDHVDIEGPAVGNQTIRGKVSRIFPQGFTKVSSLGVEQQRVLVVVQFEEGELNKLKDRGLTLKVDYRVRVKIYTDEQTQTLKIPRFALFRGAAGNWQTFVIRAGVARKVDLEVGLMNDFEVEVLSGLKEGEQVIIAPESSLTDGSRVESR